MSEKLDSVQNEDIDNSNLEISVEIMKVQVRLLILVIFVRTSMKLILKLDMTCSIQICTMILHLVKLSSFVDSVRVMMEYSIGRIIFT